MNYEQLFKKTLLREEDTSVNVSPEAPVEASPEVSDQNAWNTGNPKIVDNEELGNKFKTEGMPKEELDKYSETITKWGTGMKTTISLLAEIIDTISKEKIAGSTGSDQFTALLKNALKIKTDLSGFSSQVDDLKETIKLAIHDAAKDRKDKISSLTT